jgi:23S rRNA (adenine-N6)-dimethyltransferase
MSRRNNRAQLAQNFLVDDRVIAGVVGTLHPPPGSTVLDLGAGAGALTARAAARGARVIAVERDPAWVRVLRERAPAWGDVEVAAADIMRVTFPAEPHYVLANAPYNIGTRLVRRLLTEGHGLVQAALVLQLETARRIAGRPRSGRFSATWAPWFELRVGRRIPATAFRPVPSVESAVLTLTPRTVPLLSPVAFRAYDRFVAQAFGRGGRRVLPRGTAPSRLPPEAYAELFLSTRVTQAYLR